MSKKNTKVHFTSAVFGALCYIYSDSINKNKYKISLSLLKNLNATRLTDVTYLVFFVSS